MSARLALTAVLTGLGGAALAPTASAAPCEKTLWGCPEVDKRKELRDPQVRYDQVCARVRRALRFTQASAVRELGESVTELTEAVQLLPEQAEGWALLGTMLLELGRYDEAEPMLLRAVSLGEDSPAAGGSAPRAKNGPEVLPLGSRPATMASLDPQLETMTVTGLAFLQAQHGDVSGALERSRRLLLRRGNSHRALWRVGELLMAQGNLDEATALFERACTLPRGAITTTLEVSRSCHGLLAALDRGERARTAFILRRTSSLDADHRAVEMADLFPSYDREYYRALTLPPGCPRRAAFQTYLREAGKQPGVPAAYLRRAEEHLQAENNMTCAPEL